jgi:two-component sensor histidine kinase
MNRRVSLIVQTAAWIVLFLSPLTFLAHGRRIEPLHYIMLCVPTLLMMVVFYTNYLWLTPRYFVTGKHRYYLVVNLLLVVCLGVVQHYWMSMTHVIFDTAHRAHGYEPDHWDVVFFILRDIFNLMVVAAIATTIVLAMRWHRSEEARLAAEAAHADAELRNLRSQINPHFLLNTLNNIYALTAIDADRAQRAIQQLSKMLRHMLYDSQQELVALADEVQFLENYVNLMKIRLTGNVEVRFEPHISKPELKVAPLLFISLVENAFKHGISPTEHSYIYISIRTDIERLGDSDIRDIISCHIKNSYYPKTERDRSGHGIGLEQVQRRLELTYAGRYEWDRGLSTDGKSYSSRITIRL